MRGEEARSPKTTGNASKGTAISFRDGHHRRLLAYMHPANAMNADKLQVTCTSDGVDALWFHLLKRRHDIDNTGRVEVTNQEVLHLPERTVQYDCVQHILFLLAFSLPLFFPRRVRSDMQE